MPLLPLIERAGPPAGFSFPTDGSGPPPEILSRITAEAAAAAASVGTSILTAAAGAITSAAGIPMPSETTGPPAGFSFPAGMTGPPPGFETMTGPPAGIPTGLFGGHNPGPPKKISNHQANVMIGVTVMWVILTTSVVVGRFISRRMVKQKIGSDDIWAFISLVIFMGLCSIQFIIARFNQRLTIATAPLSFGRLRLVATLLYFFIITATRISVLLLFRRIFTLRIKWFKIAWWTSMSICVGYFFVYLVINLSTCKPYPLDSLWTRPWLCTQEMKSAIAGGFLNAGIDALLLALPIRMIWLLQMSRKQKVAVSAVFALGLIAVAISLARAISIVSPNIFTTGIFHFSIWSTAEPAVILICACLPVMRPLWLSVTNFLPSYTSIRFLLSSGSHNKRSYTSSPDTFGSNEKTLTENHSSWLPEKKVSISESVPSSTYSTDTPPVRDTPTPASALLPPRLSISKIPLLWQQKIRPTLMSRPSLASRTSEKRPSFTSRPSVPRSTPEPWDVEGRPYSKVETTIIAEKDDISTPPAAAVTQPQGWKRSLSAKYLSDIWAEKWAGSGEVRAWKPRKWSESEMEGRKGVEAEVKVEERGMGIEDEEGVERRESEAIIDGRESRQMRRSGSKAARMLGRESRDVLVQESRARREREGSGERGVRDRAEMYSGEVRGSWD